MRRRMMWYKARQPLLLGCFMTSGSCMIMIRWDRRSIKWASQWWHHVTSAENHFSNCTQISCFGHPLGTENGMLCCEERLSIAAWLFHNLALIYKDHYRRFRQQAQAPYGPYHDISVKNNSQISCKIFNFGHPLRLVTGMLWYKESHPLLLGCFLTSVSYMMMIRWGSGSIKWASHDCHNGIPVKTHFPNSWKYQIFGILSAQKMGCYAVRRDIHCCLIVS